MPGFSIFLWPQQKLNILHLSINAVSTPSQDSTETIWKFVVPKVSLNTKRLPSSGSSSLAFACEGLELALTSEEGSWRRSMVLCKATIGITETASVELYR